VSPKSPAFARRLERLFDVLLRVAAIGLLTSMFVAAVGDVSRAWDVWSYHLPFAARIAGTVSAQSFVFHPRDEARFHGFPLLCEALQGLLWRVTQRPESANLVAFFAVPVVSLFLRRRFGVPPHMAVLGLLAVPLVQIHATSCYVDLPANSAVAILVLLTLQAYAASETPSVWALVFAFGAGAFAANSKSLLHPIVFVSLGAFCIRVLSTLPWERMRRMLIVMVALLPIVFATPLKNLALYQNPYYPLKFFLAGHVFNGSEEPYSSSPVWLSGAPRPLRFAASIVELGARPMTSSRRWTIDQWTPPSDTGYRMGGYFGAYVAILLVLLFAQVFARPSRETRVVAIGFAALTAMTAMMPQCHELRYYMYWMIVLVSANLWLAVRAGRRWTIAVNLVSTVALVAVLWVTRAGYAYASGSSFVELVREKTSERRIDTVPENGTACVAREPFNLLWAAPFHPPRKYTLNEVEQASDCGELPRL
jgi:hypothetical protein